MTTLRSDHSGMFPSFAMVCECQGKQCGGIVSLTLATPQGAWIVAGHQSASMSMQVSPDQLTRLRQWLQENGC